MAGIPPKPKTDEIGTKYPDYEAYLDARDEWNAEYGPAAQRAQKIWQEQDQKRQEYAINQQLAQNWMPAQERGRQKYPDFDIVIAPLLSTKLEGPIYGTLAAHPQAEELTYRIMSDPALRSAFVGPEASPLHQAMILGNLSASLQGAAAPASAPLRQSSTAPPPYQPVGSRAKTTSPTLEELAAAGDYEGYRALKRRSQG